MYYFAICDDDKEDLLKTKTFLIDFLFQNNIREYKIIEFYDGNSLLNSSVEFDLIFLDVMLKDKDTGIDIAKILFHKNIKAKFVFISSSIEFAPESFTVKALGYIRKPIEKQEFCNYMQEILKDLLFDELYFEDKNFKIRYKNIVYIEVIHKNTIVHTVTGQYNFNKTLSFWLEQLKTQNFIRVHHSFIVNLKYIKRIKQYSILLRTNEEISLSRTYKEKLKETYNRFLGDQL